MFYLRLCGGSVVVTAISVILIVLQLVKCTEGGTFFPLNLLKFKAQGPAPIKDVENFGYIEYKPNGTLILRSTMENGTNLQNLLLFKSVLSAIKLAKLITRDDVNATQLDGFKMYGDGVEHKFPPFLERILQRIQTYFSIYKYTDTSQPLPPQKQQPQQQNDINNIFSTNNNSALEFDVDVGETVGGGVDSAGAGGGGILQSTTNIVNMNTITPTAKYTEFIAIESSSSSSSSSMEKIETD